MSAYILRLKGLTTVTTSATTLLWGAGSAGEFINLEGHRVRQLTLLFKVATQDLSSLQVYAKVHADSDQWVPIADAAADFTGGDNEYVKDAKVWTSADVYVDADLNTIEATQYGLLVLSLPGFSQLKVVCVAGTTGAIVTVDVLGYPQDVSMAAPNVQVHATVRNDVGLLNAAETEINPATQETLVTIDADTGAIKTAIELIDHLVDANSGNKGAGTQRIVIASDDVLTAVIKTNLDKLVDRQTVETAGVAMDEAVDNSGWDEIIIPAGAVYAHVGVRDESVYIVPSAATGYSGAVGAVYAVNGTYVIPCGSYNDGSGRLNCRSLSATDSKVYVTFFIN